MNEGIPTKKYFYPPLHLQRLFTANGAGSHVMLTNTERVSEDVLSLPIYESLPSEAVERTALAIRRLTGARREP